MIDDLTLARSIHVAAIVHWIGGVSVATTIVLPEVQRLTDVRAALEAFESFERRFARQARFSILIAGISGVYMLHAMHAWDRFSDARFWWLHLMVIVWFVFAVMVYLLEPFFLHERVRRRALADPAHAFSLAMRLHTVALVVAGSAIVAGVLGAHGGLP